MRVIEGFVVPDKSDKIIELTRFILDKNSSSPHHVSIGSIQVNEALKLAVTIVTTAESNNV